MKLSNTIGMTATIIGIGAIVYFLYTERAKANFKQDITSNADTFKNTDIKTRAISQLEPDRLLIRQQNIFTGAITTYKAPTDPNWFEMIRLKTLSSWTLF